MNRIFRLLLVATVTCMSTTAIAQKSTQELLGEIESSNRAAQLEMEQSRLRWQQMEADTARRHAEIDRLRAETDRLRMWNESQEALDRARATAERAERAASEQAEAARKAEEGTTVSVLALLHALVSPLRQDGCRKKSMQPAYFLRCGPTHVRATH